MMTINDPVSFYLLLVSNAVLLAAASIAVLRFQALVRSAQQFWNSPTGTSLQQQNVAQESEAGQSMNGSNQELEQRLADLQCLVDRLTEKERMHQAPVTSNLPMENAARMARHGASVSDITKSCGLNIGEAQLVKKIHSKVLPASLSA